MVEPKTENQKQLLSIIRERVFNQAITAWIQTEALYLYNAKYKQEHEVTSEFETNFKALEYQRHVLSLVTMDVTDSMRFFMEQQAKIYSTDEKVVFPVDQNHWLFDAPFPVGYTACLNKNLAAINCCGQKSDTEYSFKSWEEEHNKEAHDNSPCKD